VGPSAGLNNWENRKMSCPSQESNHCALYSTFLHRTHQYTLQGFDASGSKTLTLDVFIHIQVGLNFQRCDFCTARMFMHYEFSPLICLSYVEFGLCTQLSNKHFLLTHSGAVCQPSQLFSLCVVSATLLSLFIQ
jgi:hypothetical protein